MRALITALALAALLLAPVGAAAEIVEGAVSLNAAPVEPPRPVDIDRALTHVFIDFDDVVAPCVFAETFALRNEYLALGVSFSGPAPLDGAAILNECGNFGVSGHSSPNFLAANCSSTLYDGGTPRGPVTLTFTDAVSSCSALVGSNSGSGDPLSMEAFDVGGGLVDSDTVVLNPTMQLLGVSGTGIKTVVVGNVQPCVWVLDDLGFDTELSPVEGKCWGAIKALYR
jgi:hypothetical protein